jgi:starch phosphorylase
VTGLSIGHDGDDAGCHVGALYDRLDQTVLPLLYDDPAHWRWMMKQAIANIAHCFKSQRMMRRYAAEAYLRSLHDRAMAFESILADVERVLA